MSQEALRDRARSGSADSVYPLADVEEVREASAVQMRTEGRLWRGPGGSIGYVVLQFTDARAPQVAWPAPADVERLFPFARRRSYGGATDVMAYLEPEVFDLRCRPAGRERFRCSYVVTVTDWLNGTPPRDRHTDLFERRDGRWRILARDASPEPRY